LILGHEITGEVVETGPGVEFIKEGDLVSTPFNISCWGDEEEDPRPDDAVGHLPHRLPRLRIGRGRYRGHGVCRRRGPVGLAAAHSAQLLGAAAVIVGDAISERLDQARSFGCETVDISADASIRCQIARAVNAAVITLDDAPEGYQAFDHGAAKKFVLDPHGEVAKAA
jgi:threonine dehydrogenase-like Zn-dependent dehydrogenase